MANLPSSFCDIATYIKNTDNLGVASDNMINNNPYRLVEWQEQNMCFISALYKILQSYFTSMTWGGIATSKADVLSTVDVWGAELDVALPLIIETNIDGNRVGDWYDLPSGYCNHIITDHEWQELVAFCGDLSDQTTATRQYATVELLYQSTKYMDYGEPANAQIYNFANSGTSVTSDTIMTSSTVSKLFGFRHTSSSAYGANVYSPVATITEAIFPYAMHLTFPSNNKIYYVDEDADNRFAPWWGSFKTERRNLWTSVSGYQSTSMSNKYARIGGSTSTATAYYVGGSTSYALGMYSPQTGWENYTNNYLDPTEFKSWTQTKNVEHVTFKMVAPDYSGVDATFDRIVAVDDDENFVTYFGVKSGETDLYFNGNFSPGHPLYRSGSTCDFLPQNIAFYCILNTMRWGREEKYGYKQINNGRFGQW